VKVIILIKWQIDAFAYEMYRLTERVIRIVKVKGY